ncbi:hypothetical protein MtrunA17_Chr3g0132271 [Medicago truncatula]|uniref:Channel forming colicins domain-containing protein n=1 Tax=Medicago truncatula TaxID=3880 RepID=G7J3X6_MEDTR|nr:uncharacterized protein LOC11429706 [Medicago truncatula]AES73071.2 hypothetical protein MTR_3g099350 [Medicago truncatula]RHN70130.1 hypothetical protein MtrunA17_Chr3g0132271 [Medicago truncatula]
MSNSGDANAAAQEQEQEWATMAQAWLCSFPEPKEVTMAEVEAWIDSNLSSLPEGIQSMPRPDLCHRLISIQNCMRLPNQEKEGNNVDVPHARFQRTDQWLPVYAWLETLNKDEVVKSKEISEWLEQNPDIQEQLCSRHTRYHLMHYVKKCHFKILKRRQKGKGLELPGKELSLKVQKDVPMKRPAPLPSTPVINLPRVPKDSDLFLAKKNEAYQKYQILLELEKLFSPIFSKLPITNQ